MMTSHDFTFDRESLIRLSAMRGQTWKCFGSLSMAANLATPFSAFFVADARAITLASIVDYYDIDADPYHTTIAELSIAEGADELDEATRSGHIYLFHLGEKVIDVVVIRDTIIEHRDGSRTWKIVKDVGVVFVLSNGVIAVSQLGLHDEMLQVTIGESIASLKLPVVQRKWIDVLGIEYDVSREFIAVSELLTAQ